MNGVRDSWTGVEKFMASLAAAALLLALLAFGQFLVEAVKRVNGR